MTTLYVVVVVVVVVVLLLLLQKKKKKNEEFAEKEYRVGHNLNFMEYEQAVRRKQVFTSFLSLEEEEEEEEDFSSGPFRPNVCKISVSNKI